MLANPPTAKIREVLSVTFPLMLSALSGTLMLFCDRLILARYSLDVMNAAAVSLTISVTFMFSAMSISSIAEVFVGQHNGAKQYDKLASPVWQMLWFSLLTALAFIPMALWGDTLLLPSEIHDTALPYYRWVVGFGFLISTIGALVSFFVGQGKVILVTVAAVIGNLLNLILDLALIFGVDGYIPEMGIEGAGIATVASQVIQVAILLFAFLSPKNNKAFNTWKPAIDIKLFMDCLRIGIPNALGHMAEFAAWGVLMIIAVKKSCEFISVIAIGQTFHILYAFITDGLEKGVTAISANLIGAHLWARIKKLFLSSLVVLFATAGILSIPLLFFPSFVVDLFIATHQDPKSCAIILEQATLTLRWVATYLFFDGVIWIIAGILVSAGDTKFIMFANAINTWLFAIMPLYLIIEYTDWPSSYIWAEIAAFSIINLAIFYYRYHSGKWKKLVLT